MKVEEIKAKYEKLKKDIRSDKTLKELMTEQQQDSYLIGWLDCALYLIEKGVIE